MAISEGGIGDAPVEQSLGDASQELIGDGSRRRLAYGGGLAGRFLPKHSCLWVRSHHSEIVAVGVKEFQRAVQVVRHKIAAHWALVWCGVDDIAGRIHVPEPQPRRRCEAWWQGLDVRSIRNLKRLGFQQQLRVNNAGGA